jgi:hypothetical protein
MREGAGDETFWRSSQRFLLFCAYIYSFPLPSLVGDTTMRCSALWAYTHEWAMPSSCVPHWCRRDERTDLCSPIICNIRVDKLVHSLKPLRLSHRTRQSTLHSKKRTRPD